MSMIEFTWMHAPGAFEIEGRGLSTGGKKWFDVYSPPKISTLFQKFADAPHSPEGMRDFFNKYGPLEFSHHDSIHHPFDRHAVGSPSAGLRSISLLLQEPLVYHGAFCKAVSLKENGDLSALTNLFNRGWAQVRTELRPRLNEKVEIVFIPNSLIQFIWLQFSLFVASGVKLLRCERCSEPMIVGPGTGHRETAKFCSNACKVASFKEKHNHA